MTLDEIKEFLGNDWKETDGLIRSSLRSDIDLLNTTNEAILEHSGKQLRPIVSLLVARACGNGKANEDSVSCAAASELLHNATLLHDDVADSSSERRGAPTVMAILGGPASVLLGDYWLVKAMDNILASSAHGNEVIRIFSKTLSSLAEGEMLQLQKASSGDTEEEDCLILSGGEAHQLPGLQGGGLDPRLPQGPPDIQGQIVVCNSHYQASFPCSSGSTSFKASMATSSMESSGSLVVKFCSHIPGADRIRVTALSWRPTKRLNS